MSKSSKNKTLIVKAQKIFEILGKSTPNPKIELNYTNNFTLMVAVVLSARNTDVGVNKATLELFKVCDSPYKMLELGEDGLLEHIKTIGLCYTKAKNIISASKILIEKYNGDIPNNFDDLVSLPGVGRKSANVILNTAFGQPRIGVDTHVFRVSRRVGIASLNTPAKVEEELVGIISDDLMNRGAHHMLVLHGRYICKSRKPNCENCVIKMHCDFYKNSLGLV